MKGVPALVALLAFALPGVRGAAPAPVTVSFESDGGYVLQVEGEHPVRSAPLSIFVGGARRTLANKGLVCGAVAAGQAGTDKFGAFTATQLGCHAGDPAAAAAMVPVDYEWRAYSLTPTTGERCRVSPGSPGCLSLER